MDKESNSFTMMFAAGMCVVLAILLAGTYATLKPNIDANVAFDQKKNVLIATGLYSKAEPKPQSELERLYDDYIVAQVLEVVRDTVDEPYKEAGEKKTRQVEKVVDMVPVEGKVPEDIKQLERDHPEKEYVAFYTRVVDKTANEPVAYSIPISGMGLWGLLYGYLALQADLDHVQGITFYKHKETPGLGGDVDRLDWQAQWRSKTIYDDAGNLVSVTVKKGKVDPSVPYEAAHMVDGLSGATITSNGVSRFVKADLEKYESHFRKLK